MSNPEWSMDKTQVMSKLNKLETSIQQFYYSQNFIFNVLELLVHHMMFTVEQGSIRWEELKKAADELKKTRLKKSSQRVFKSLGFLQSVNYSRKSLNVAATVTVFLPNILLSDADTLRDIVHQAPVQHYMFSIEEASSAEDTTTD